MADFCQSAKGGPFAKFSKWPIFLAELRKLQKIGNTSPIMAILRILQRVPLCTLAKIGHFEYPLKKSSFLS